MPAPTSAMRDRFTYKLLMLLFGLGMADLTLWGLLVGMQVIDRIQGK